jgi:hypothetical protein
VQGVRQSATIPFQDQTEEKRMSTVDGQSATGAYVLRAEAGERAQRARPPYAPAFRWKCGASGDVIQPLPRFSTIFDSAFDSLRMEIAKMPPPDAAYTGAHDTAMTVEDHRR